MAKLDSQILAILQNSDGHMSADQVFVACQSAGIKSSVASVYRVLSKLAADGKIRRVALPGHADLFDKTLPDHEHLVCEVCGCVSDFTIAGLDELIEQATGVHPDSFSLTADYICESCKTKSKEML